MFGVIDENAENQIHSEKTMKLADYAVHYKNIYRLHNIEVADFFRRHSPVSLYTGTLEDPEK